MLDSLRVEIFGCDCRDALCSLFHIPQASKMSVKVGDSVTYSKYAGTEFAVEGVDHLLLKEEDCIGTMEGVDVSSMTPLGDRVLIKCTEAEEETAGGLLLTGSKEKPLTGEVVAVGPGKDEEAMGVAVGNSVMYSKYSGSEYEVSCLNTQCHMSCL
mmetsp:Transcript_9766/g.18405  ORF Transcript_9766/g.18405 Transcript_9766/m.18405 type:complete len:156 (-) Transcript_9766:544-1011(-)